MAQEFYFIKPIGVFGAINDTVEVFKYKFKPRSEFLYIVSFVDLGD